MVSLHQSGQYWKINYKDDLFTVFSGDRFFWGNERKYFTHIPGLCKSLRFKRKKMLLLNCFAIVKHIKSLISKNVAGLSFYVHIWSYFLFLASFQYTSVQFLSFIFLLITLLDLSLKTGPLGSFVLIEFKSPSKKTTNLKQQ